MYPTAARTRVPANNQSRRTFAAMAGAIMATAAKTMVPGSSRSPA